jgi:predicted MFS family arabinose efflux permease
VVLALLLAASVCSYVDRYILPLLQETIKIELHLSDSALGLATGPAFAMFYALSSLPVARLAERFDRRKLLTATVAFWSTMTAVTGMANSLSVLVLCRFGVGAGEGGGVPTSHSLLSDYFPRNQRGMAMAVLSMGAPIAGILMPLVGGYVAHVWGWRVAFFALGGAGLVLAAAIYLVLRDPRTGNRVPRNEPQPFARDLRWLFGNPAYAWLFAAGALMGIGQAGFGVFLPSLLMRVHGLGLVEAGTVLAIGGVVGVAGTFAGGYLADRFGGGRGQSYPLVCALSAVLTGIGYLGALFSSAWPVVFMFLVLAMCTSDMKTGPNYAAVQNLVPVRMRATAAAVFMIAATLIGSSTGPLLAGIVSDAVADAAFPAHLGEFLAACPGGRAPAGAAASLAEACLAAGGAGLETAMKVVALSYVGAAVAFAMCARYFAPHDGEAG